MLKEKFIYESILFEKAAKYRLSLIKKNFTETEKKQYIIDVIRNTDINLAQTQIVNEIFNNNIARAQTYDRNLKNTMMYLYFYNEYKENYNQYIVNFKDNLRNYFKSLSNELLNIEGKLESAEYSSRNNKTKNVFKNTFKERGEYEKYRREDPKQSIGFSFRERLSSDNNLLRLREINKVKLVPREIFLVEEESFNGDTTRPVYTNSIYNLREESSPFRFLVLKKNYDKTKIKLKQEVKGLEYPYNKKVQQTSLFDFVAKKKINNIQVKTASSLPLNLESIKYWDGSSWLEVTVFTKEENNLFNCYFETIKTNKVKITFSQTKYLDIKSLKDGKTENDILLDKSYLSFFGNQQETTEGYLHDLSLDTVEFFYSLFRKKGLYVENDMIEVEKPVSFQFDLNYLMDSSIVYAEKFLNIVLYGEDSLLAFKKKMQLEEDAKLKNPRLNKVIPVPEKTTTQKELLVFNRNQAKLNFFPSKSNFTVMVNEIELGTDKYQVSMDGGETFIELAEFQQNPSTDYVAGNFIIKIEEVEATKKYEAVYSLAKKQTVKDTDILIKNNKIVLPKELRNSYGFVRPLIILRSKDNVSDKTDIIKSYRVTIGEKESLDIGYIEYERFIERTARGINNVIE